MKAVLCLALSLLALSLAAAGPAVWQIQDPVQPGETVMLFGDGFGDKPQVLLGRADDDSAGIPGGRGSTDVSYGEGATVLQASDQCLKVLIASKQKPGLYSLLVGDPRQAATAVLLNRPALWWMQTDWGGKPALRLFGKNLAGPKAQVYLKGPKSMALKIGKQADTWAATVGLPDKLPDGDYEVFYHSGRGGVVGWSMGMSLTIARPKPWPATVYNARDFGADGLGTRDDTGSIQDALNKAGAAGGGVVLLPRGRYQITAGLTMPRFVTLRGVATDQTALFWPDMATPPEALIQGTNSFALENLTLYASMAKHIIVGDLGDKPESGNVRLVGVRTRVDAYRGHLSADEADKRLRELGKISGGDSVRLGGDNLRIENCDLYGSGRALFLSRTCNGIVRGNALYNGRHGWYCISGSDGLVFENNTITGADLMATGGGLNCLDGSSYSQNVYYAHNTLRLMHGWDREAMTSDAGGGLYYGPIAQATGATLTLPEALNPGRRNWAGAAVFIFSGKGWSQYRRVAKVEGDTVTVDRPWDVPPDATSLVGITMLQRHYILDGNSFSDAGIAVQFYGSSLEHIVAGNTCARAGGYQGIGKAYGGYQLPPDKNPCHQPSWFCQYVDNEIAEGAIYRSGANNSILSGDSVIGVFGWPLTRDWPWPYNVGSVVRGNRLDNNARIHVGGNGNDKPTVSDVVVENNTVSNADEAVRLDRAVRGVLVRGNVLDNVRDPLTGGGLDRGTFDGAQLAAAERSRLRAVAREAGVTDDPAKWPTVAVALEATDFASVTMCPFLRSTNGSPSA
ncbi:MAG: right-handed parallel beta-helix repeat-containing protein [Armatimonadetes bacterium]|nr:right-handed parallel beta-helix repeat-containing protein [Armatimonadota bacterium]